MTWRAWIDSWGATDNEISATLPGDEYMPDAENIATRAVTVHAPAERVWPWLQQIDQQRGGFYSYRRLENLFGCEMPSVRRLVGEWHERRVGESVWMVPPRRYNGEGHVMVARVDHERALVLLSPDVSNGETPKTAMSGSWAFVLVPVDAHTTRWITRSRYARRNALFDIVHFMMERKMMRTIAALAEATPVGAAQRT